MKTQVVIIGCGPIGATLGNLLGRRGISAIIVEKQATPFGLPRAIHFDGEAMRVFQAAGLTDEILPSTMVGRGMLFKDNQDNILIDWSREQSIGPMGWFESYRVHQPGLEQALNHGLERFADIQVLRGVSVVEAEQSATEAKVTLSNGETIQADYVVGCDGATSLLRNLLNITTDDLGYKERWLVVDLMLSVPRDDLGDYSIQFCDEENPATYVRGVGDRRRWEMRLKPEDPDQLSDEVVWQKLKRWIGSDDAKLERSAVYTFRSCVANKWCLSRFFLAGDAAHQMPPFMGQGMCAGIRDVANLAWKLDHVLNGADASLLDTYFSERNKNVRQFIELTVKLGKLINQSASGHIPKGNMKSIWPSLGEGFGIRDGVGGELAPQLKSANGTLADTAADHGFYVLSKKPMNSSLPVFVGNWEKLDEFGADAALIRPDGYAAAAIRDDADAAQYLKAYSIQN